MAKPITLREWIFYHTIKGGKINCEKLIIVFKQYPRLKKAIRNRMALEQSLNIRTFYPELIRKYAEQGSFDLMQIMIKAGWGSERVENIEHWEDEWNWD